VFGLFALRSRVAALCCAHTFVWCVRRERGGGTRWHAPWRRRERLPARAPLTQALDRIPLCLQKNAADAQKPALRAEGLLPLETLKKIVQEEL
jgi:hypothetical protein